MKEELKVNSWVDAIRMSIKTAKQQKKSSRGGLKKNIDPIVMLRDSEV